jgi:hypothetical protein
MHKLHLPTLFMKLDIHKAFDTVNWSYLLEVLQALGFGAHWRDWISFLFRTATSYATAQWTKASHLRPCQRRPLGRPPLPHVF